MSNGIFLKNLPHQNEATKENQRANILKHVERKMQIVVKGTTITQTVDFSTAT